MSREIELISVCMRSRESFETANDLLDWKDWTPLGVRIFNAIQDFYKRDPECKSADYRYVYEYATKSMSSEAQKEQARDVLQEAKGIDVSPGNVIAHAIELRRAAIGERLAESLCNGEHDHDLFEEYTRLIETEDLSSLLGDELHDVELDDLMEVLDQKNKIKMYPKSLNERMEGGLVRGDNVLVGARPECYAEGTEILTETGWVDFADLPPDVKVAAVDNKGRVTYEVPSSHDKQYVDEPLVQFSSKRNTVNLLVTRDHSMVFIEDGLLGACGVGDFSCTNYKRNYPSSAFGKTQTQSEKFTAIDALRVAFQADGSHVSQVKSGACTGARYGTLPIRFSLTKERKIHRLKSIMDDLGLDYTVSDLSRGKKREFYVKVPVNDLPSKTFDWVNPSSRSAEWLEAFIEELSHWDATRRSESRIKYDTAVKVNADVVQESCTLVGYRTCHSIYKDERKESYKDIHSVTITKRIPYYSSNSVTKELVDYKGYVYCVGVSTGMIVVRRNNCVAISGNCGKSAFVITNMAGMAFAGHKVLYCGNEDAIKKIIVRLVSCLTGKTALEMMKDPKATMELARQRGYNNIVFAHPVLTTGHISTLCRKHKPDVVFVDQVRNLKVKADNRVGQLEAAGIGMRNIAAEHKVLAIGVTQVGESGEGKLRLGMGDIDGSKTGLQASCDVMILIGVDNAFDMNNSRMLNLAKNKTGGGHDAWAVKINPSISRYADE